MKLIMTSLTAVMLLASADGFSAVMIEMKDSEGMSRIYAEGPEGRMEMASGNEYMVINGKDNTFYLVSPDDKSVMDMSGFLNDAPGTRSGSPVKSELKRRGDGPEIAGYDTVEYEMLANGKSCGVVFGSKDALEKVNEFAEVFAKMAARGSAMAAQFGVTQDPCIAAADESPEALKKTGFPMRSLDENGALLNEVVRIDTDAKLPANAFTIPPDYARRDMAQMQRDGQQQMQEYMPQMEQMMKQMQESGELPPGAREQMEQMRQRYQPR